MSRYAERTSRLTSRRADGGTTFASVSGAAGAMTPPQKSRAWSMVMSGPRPATSRSTGRKTDCRYGRMVVYVNSQSSTSVGINLSSGVARKVRSIVVNPAVRRSRRSSRTLLGLLLWMQNWMCICTMRLMSSTGKRTSSPWKTTSSSVLRYGQASSIDVGRFMAILAESDAS